MIDARLEAFPKLSAQRLFDEVRSAGYPGGYGRVRDYVSLVRPREPVGPDELLFDQMRAVVLSDDRAAGGGLLLNAEFLRFAAHWGFMPRSCRPYRVRTKGNAA